MLGVSCLTHLAEAHFQSLVRLVPAHTGDPIARQVKHHYTQPFTKSMKPSTYNISFHILCQCSVDIRKRNTEGPLERSVKEAFCSVPHGLIDPQIPMDCRRGGGRAHMTPH